MIVSRTEYKGNKMIEIKNNEDDKYPISFGYKKAKKVAEAIDEIRRFIEDCEAERDEKNI